jgi:glycerol kinase
MEMLPTVLSSSEIYGTVNIGGVDVPISGVAGDQQAALFGQTCFEKGQAKNTYGTGCFLLMHTGGTPAKSEHGLITTIAATRKGQPTQYALEGSVFVGGAVIQWVRDALRLITDAEDSEYYAMKAKDTGGVYLVPAFTGLGAPYWDMHARGTIVGLTRGTGRRHIVRAALESIAYQTQDVIAAMEQDIGGKISALQVDGGASANKFLMQFQADISDVEIRRPLVRETTALGAALLAGLAVGYWKDEQDIINGWTPDNAYTPKMDISQRTAALKGWHKAVKAAKVWAEED